MISRVAENSFWLTRDLERVQTVARILRVNRNFLLDIHKLEHSNECQAILMMMREKKRFEKNYPHVTQEQESESIQEYFVFNLDHPSSIYNNLKLARENARSIRENLSLPMWESINSLWLWFDKKECQTQYKENRDIFYQKIIEKCQLFEGLLQTNVRQDESYTFLNLGLMLERAYQLRGLIDFGLHSMNSNHPKNNPLSQEDTTFKEARWLMILQCVHGQEAFFKKSMQAPSSADIFDFLIFDPLFPRSAYFCLHKITQLIQALKPRPFVLKEIKNLNASLFQSLDQHKEPYQYVRLILKTLQRLEKIIQKEFFDTAFKTKTEIF